MRGAMRKTVGLSHKSCATSRIIKSHSLLAFDIPRINARWVSSHHSHRNDKFWNPYHMMLGKSYAPKLLGHLLLYSLNNQNTPNILPKSSTNPLVALVIYRDISGPPNITTAKTRNNPYRSICSKTDCNESGIIA